MNKIPTNSSNNPNDWVIVIGLSLAFIFKPVSYSEMRLNHPVTNSKIELTNNNQSPNLSLSQAELLGSTHSDVQLANRVFFSPQGDQVDESVAIGEVIKDLDFDNELNIGMKERINSETRPDKRSSFFVEGLVTKTLYLSRPGGSPYNYRRLYLPNMPLNKYEPTRDMNIKSQLVLEAHQNCFEEIPRIPRKLVKKDERIDYDSKFIDIFNKTYESVFNYNLLVEENLGKDAPISEIEAAKKRLYKKYKKKSKAFLESNLFRSPYAYKLENYKYGKQKVTVTIYYDPITDIFGVISEKNVLLDLGLASLSEFVEIFALQSLKAIRDLDIYDLLDPPNFQTRILKPDQSRAVPRGIIELDEAFQEAEQEQEIDQPQEKPKFSALLDEANWLDPDEAAAILRTEYGDNYIIIANDFEMDEWQTCKKIKHAHFFGLDPKDYGFSTQRAYNITDGTRGLVGYVQRNGRAGLPSRKFVNDYQQAVKNFCEGPNIERKEGIFRGQPAFIFFDKTNRIVVAFKQDTKRFISAQQFRQEPFDRSLESGNFGQTYD